MPKEECVAIPEQGIKHLDSKGEAVLCIKNIHALRQSCLCFRACFNNVPYNNAVKASKTTSRKSRHSLPI